MNIPENDFAGLLGLTHEGYFDRDGNLRPCTVLRVLQDRVWRIVMTWEEIGRPMNLDDALVRVINIIRQSHGVAEHRGSLGELRKALVGVFLPGSEGGEEP